jgi:hypothetical protein
MEHYAPLIQTALWVILVAGIVWRFNAPIEGLLTALQKRIEAGSSIKAGPFEISDLRPQIPEKQAEKASAEIREILQEPATDKVENPPLPSVVRTQYFQSEDLALRAIQAEFGVPINRQVTGGQDLGFDGVFASNGTLHIIEVKYSRGRIVLDKLKQSIDQISSYAESYGWKNYKVILAIVFESDDDMAACYRGLTDFVSAQRVNVVLRPYSLPVLTQKFGAFIE